MALGTVGAGVYELGTAAYLLGMDERTVLRWSTATPTAKRALVLPSHGWAFSFQDVLSLALTAVLRQRGVRLDGIRNALNFLEAEFSVPRPFAHRDIVEALRTAGHSLFLVPDVDLTARGQLVIIEYVDSYLRPVSYDDNLLARRWAAAPEVVLDADIQAGRPCIVGTRVTTDVVAYRVRHGETAGEVADDLGITFDQVLAARQFETRLQRGEGLALVA